MKRLWVLNLDAERELALPDGYTRPRVMAEQIQEQSASTRDLVRDEAVLALDATKAPEGANAETVVAAWYSSMLLLTVAFAALLAFAAEKGDRSLFLSGNGQKKGTCPLFPSAGSSSRRRLRRCRDA